MDADDVSWPQRIERQLAFMSENADIDICGCWAQTIGEEPNQLWEYPTSDAQIEAEMIFASVLVHSSVMMRKASIMKYKIRYDENLTAAQDYELWVRLLHRTQAANLTEILCYRRMGDNNISVRRERAQRLNALKAKILWARLNGFKMKILPPVLRDLTVVLAPNAVKKLVRWSLHGG